MSAGDFIVRRNVSNVDNVPDVRDSILTLDYDTAVANVGSGITESAGVHTLGETGRFLIAASDFLHTDDVTNNERLNWRTQIYLAGALLNEGQDSGYIRKSGGQQDYVTQVMAYVNVATTTGNGDDLEIRHRRIDDVVVGTLDRVSNNRGGISILKLDDSWNYAHYRSSAAYTPSVTDNTRNQAQIGTTVEEDGTVFSRSGNVITVLTANPVIVMWTHYNDITDVTTGRTEMGGSIDFDTVELVRGVNQTYGPRSQGSGDDAGGMTGATIIYPDNTGQALEFNLISYEDATEDWFTEVQLIELPSGAETATVERTTPAGNYNGGSEFAFESIVSLDTAAFSHTPGDFAIEVDNAGDYWAMANIGDFTDAGVAGARALPGVRFRASLGEGGNLETAGATSYNRQSGTADHAHLFLSALVTGLSATHDLWVNPDAVNTTVTTTMIGVGGFSMIRLSSLFDGPPATLDQVGYRFYDDDAVVGSETALANEDTNITRSQEAPFRLRVQTDVTGDPDASALSLQYKEVSDGAVEWRDVPL